MYFPSFTFIFFWSPIAWHFFLFQGRDSDIINNFQITLCSCNDFCMYKKEKNKLVSFSSHSFYVKKEIKMYPRFLSSKNPMDCKSRDTYFSVVPCTQNRGFWAWLVPVTAGMPKKLCSARWLTETRLSLLRKRRWRDGNRVWWGCGGWARAQSLWAQESPGVCQQHLHTVTPSLCTQPGITPSCLEMGKWCHKTALTGRVLWGM